MFLRFTGYAPDIDPYSTGVLTYVENYLPTLKGYKAAPSNTQAGFPALAEACNGAALCQLLNGSYRMFAGTASAIYEGNSSLTWDDRSKVGGYSGSGDHRWSFAQFGDTTIAAMKTETLQASTGSGTDFADISGAPKARFVETIPGFVVLADTDDGVDDYSDRWHCSAFEDATDWTPSVATQCTTGRLVGAPGRITALKRLGDDIVVYKDKAIFVGRYVGAPVVIDFDMIPGEVGAVSNESVVNIDTAHVFVGYDNFYMFDGSRPIPIGDEVKETFFADLNKSYRHKIIGVHDRFNSLAIFFYPDNSSTTCNRGFAYNYKNNKWGRIDRGVEAVVEYVSGQVTYANLDDFFASYADINVTYDSPFWLSGSPVLSLIDTTHILNTATGTPGEGRLETGFFGDDDTFSTITRVRPRFFYAPDDAWLSNLYSNLSAAELQLDQTDVNIDSGKFDILRSARWHKMSIRTDGQCVMDGFSVDLIPDEQE